MIKNFKDYKDYFYSDYIDNPQERGVEETLSLLFQDFVPDRGKASTVLGEIVRAANRVMVRFYNDGDMAFIDEGVNTVDSSLCYLLDVIPTEFTKENRAFMRDLKAYSRSVEDYNENKNAYDHMIYSFMELIILYLEDDFENIVDLPNSVDSNDMPERKLEKMYDFLGVNPRH